MDHPYMHGGGASAGTVQKFCYVSGGQAEVAGRAILMELLEDTPPADHPPEDVDDQVSRVIRSLEAEIGGGTAPAPVPATAGDNESTADGLTSDDGGLEDMLSDFDASPGTCSAEAPSPLAVPFDYLAELPPAMGHDMGGWYVDGEGVVAGYEFTEQCCYTYGEGSAVEQVYSPLWE